MKSRLSPSGYLTGLVVVTGLGCLLIVARTFNRKAVGHDNRKGGKPMKRASLVSAGVLETLWVAGVGALQAPKG